MCKFSSVRGSPQKESWTDECVSLLETGSTSLIRITAAQQLADVQKSHPEELYHLLERVVPYLRSKSWETRVAAARALEGIASHVHVSWIGGGVLIPKQEQSPDTDDGMHIKLERNPDRDFESAESFDTTGLNLKSSTLSLQDVLSRGIRLAARAENNPQPFLHGYSIAERLHYQQTTLPFRLGITDVMPAPVKAMEDASAELLAANSNYATTSLTISTQFDSTCDNGSDRSQMDQASPGSLNVHQMSGSGTGESLSRRQLNALKRKAKASAREAPNKVRILEGPRPSPKEVALPSRNGSMQSTEYFDQQSMKTEPDGGVLVSEFKGFPVVSQPTYASESEGAGISWPFTTLCEYLLVDLFDSAWETRHGAAMGLREILRLHGSTAGQRAGTTGSRNHEANIAWLDNAACHIVCLLTLDRFADFGSDKAVAPVRETASQALGSLARHIDLSLLESTQQLLQDMILQTQHGTSRKSWEVCQGGMLGLKYIVAVRRESLLQQASFLDKTLYAVNEGLSSVDDDVRAASAAVLTPIATQFVQLRPGLIASVLDKIWDSLENLSDDLSASTGSVMELLATLCTFPMVLQTMKDQASHNPSHRFEMLVPRLYPFLRHTIASVRYSALRALQTLLLSGGSALSWITGKTFRLLFQILILEREKRILELASVLWDSLLNSFNQEDRKTRLVAAVQPHLEPMVELLLHPFGLPRYHFPLSPALLLKPSDPDPVMKDSGGGDLNGDASKRRKKRETRGSTDIRHEHNVDVAMIQGDVELLGTEVFFRAKIFAARALGELLQRLSHGSTLDNVVSRVSQDIRSHYYTSRYAAALLVASSTGSHDHDPCPVACRLRDVLAQRLEYDNPPYYCEFVGLTRTLRAQCLNFLSTLKDSGRLPSSKLPTITVTVQGEDNANSSAFSPSQAQKMLVDDYEKLLITLSVADRTASKEIVTSSRASAVSVLEGCYSHRAEADLRVKSAASCALVALSVVPSKPGPIITSLMESLRKEHLAILQSESATAVANLVDLLSTAGRRAPVEKVIRNLAKYLCVDTTDTPIISLDENQDRSIMSLQKDEDVHDNPQYETEVQAARITHRGAREGLCAISRLFGPTVLGRLPVLEKLFSNGMLQSFSDHSAELGLRGENCTLGQEIVDGLSLLRTLSGCLHSHLHPVVADLLPPLARASLSKLGAIRYAAAKCFAAISRVLRFQVFTTLVSCILPKISDSTNLHNRQGAIEVIYHLISVLGDEILPYVIFLIVPVLGRMSDSDEQIRLLATTSFATLVKLVPLEAGLENPPEFSQEMLEGRERERSFVAQMLDPKKIDPFKLPVAIRAELRPYQQEGVNWLAFLNRYQLHGILCDDMGLGKTLQTLCIVASDHHQRAEEFAKTSSADQRKLPSLIVCPPTLSGHWQQEMRTYAPFLTSMAYVGVPSNRERLRGQLSQMDVVITSYEVCRNDIGILAALEWNYCVLDEGHLIKNSKSKISAAVKRLNSNHRLILSGTPVQNNVVELWSLFDFLMPGFLGSERIFAERYAKPIAASRFAKSSSKEQEAGALAVEALHKQVLPFLLRRLKEEVLEDLPPKIVQNYYCEPSELQKHLFAEFNKQESQSLADDVGKGDKESKQHIFQALQYMRKICNSPALVLKSEAAKARHLKSTGYDPDDPAQAPKLGALKDLLVDCGIGAESVPSSKGLASNLGSGVSQHRALIFCQMREMLDIVQKKVLKKMLPGIQYLRLDGSIEASRRQDIVNTFNADPSYDVLLLTTSVGGLGLNLTGADTVIFIEHDWNPQKDLQAMDRAHRIGQKKVVNVYRLIMKGSIEEKIMNLQRFKMDVAGTVVNQQNIGLGSMQTDELLDLFTVADSATGIDLGGRSAADAARDDGVDITGEVNKPGKKGVLHGMEELWDESQYTEEYNLDGFLAKMNGA